MIGSKGFRNRERALAAQAQNGQFTVPRAVTQYHSWELSPVTADHHATEVLNHRLQQPLIEAVMLASEEVATVTEQSRITELTGILVTPTDVYRAVKAECNKRRKGKASALITKTVIPLPVSTPEEAEAARHGVPSKYALGFEDRGDNRLTTRVYERHAFELPRAYAATHLYMAVDPYSTNSSTLTEINGALQAWKDRHPIEVVAESDLTVQSAAFGHLPKLQTRTYLRPVILE